ncbi:hypothetical protein HDU79_005747 [Rhizoclosmatium sp. JEL0117]|nr:hypothetical protein HDU79_005747 [Rhizoclosmatium sp. JEL0117]
MDHTASTPTELMHQILSWIPPLELLPLQRTNKRFQSLLLDPHFASLNLRKHVTAITLESTVPDAMDKALFHLPPSYQTALAQFKYKQVIRIVWEAKRFTGSLPVAAFPQMTGVHFLSWGHNQFTGGIPPELGLLVNLRHLSLSRSPLGGEIPPELGILVNLEYCGLNGCQFTGRLPVEMANMTNLRVLYLGGNQLEGPIPSEFGQLINLEVFHCLKNKFSGSLPREVELWTKLREFLISHNEFEGALPDFTKWVEVGRIDVTWNRFSGVVVDGVENLESLECLYVLAGNNGIAVDGEQADRIARAVRKCDLTPPEWSKGQQGQSLIL